MSEKSTLKPCPFCGIKAEINDISKTIVDDRVCGCWADNIFLTKEDWNTRPVEDALRARAMKAEADNDVLRAERDRAESMVAILIDAGKIVLMAYSAPYYDHKAPKEMFEALVNEWEQRSRNE